MVTTANDVITLYKVDVATAQKTVIKSGLAPSGTRINAIGYNALDNRLYGVMNAADGTNTLIRIGSNGDLVNVRSMPTGYFNAGDVDENGQFWASQSGSDWIQIDLKSLTIISSGSIANLPFNGIYDFAYVPKGGNYLYTVAGLSDNNAHLFRFDREKKTWAQFGQATGYGKLYDQTPTIGAVYASQEGDLYTSDNIIGMIFKVSLDGKTSQYISTGAAATANDGAHCINNSAV